MGRKAGSLTKKTLVIAEMLRYPLSQKVISATMGCSQQNISNVAQRLSIEVKRPIADRISVNPRVRTWRRFIKNIYFTPNCWFWIGPFASEGYGRIGKNYTHRLALYYFRGIQVGKTDDVLHECDTPQCVNPGHLRIGTARENVRDSMSKGICHGPQKLLNKQTPHRKKVL